MGIEEVGSSSTASAVTVAVINDQRRQQEIVVSQLLAGAGLGVQVPEKGALIDTVA